MPPKNKVKYSPAAVDDMDEIFSYISKNEVSAAENLLKKHRVIQDTVVIHRILHGRRDYLRELFGSFE